MKTGQILNEQQHDMENRYKLHKDIMKFIYARQINILEKSLVAIAYQNQKILNAITPTFMFQGDLYPKSLTPGLLSGIIPNKILHPTLYHKVFNLLNKESEEQEYSRIRIQHYVTLVIDIANNVTDFKKLIPETIYQYLITECFMIETGPISPSLSANTITEFKKKNKKGLAEINKIFLTQLLLPDV